jgi:hypothetical protein
MLGTAIFANAQFTTQGVATSLGTGMYNLPPPLEVVPPLWLEQYGQVACTQPGPQ